MRKRLGVGAESLEFPVVPWGLIVVENHPGQQQGEVAGPARLSSRPHTAPRGSLVPGPGPASQMRRAGVQPWGEPVFWELSGAREEKLSIELCSFPGGAWHLGGCDVRVHSSGKCEDALNTVFRAWVCVGERRLRRPTAWVQIPAAPFANCEHALA